MKPAHDSIDDSIDDSIALSVSSYSGWQIMALYDSPRFSARILCGFGDFVLSGSDILVRSFGAKNLKTSHWRHR